MTRVRAWTMASIGAAMGLAMAAGPAMAAPPPGSADPESVVVEALVVTAKHPAPAWWRVEDPNAKEGSAGATVWILGVLDAPLPADVSWRREELDGRLKGAKALVTGAQLHAGLEDIFGLLSLWSMMRTDDMAAGLDPALAARFAADRERLGQGPERYQHWRPMIAGSMLLRQARPAGAREVGRQVRADAAKAGVPAKPAGVYDFLPFAKTALGSAKMLLTSTDTPQELRRKVTSPGGTTHAAITHMESQGMPQIIVDALKAAQRRGRELGK